MYGFFYVGIHIKRTETYERSVLFLGESYGFPHALVYARIGMSFNAVFGKLTHYSVGTSERAFSGVTVKARQVSGDSIFIILPCSLSAITPMSSTVFPSSVSGER